MYWYQVFILNNNNFQRLKNMSLTRPNPFNRPSPFRPSEQHKMSSSPYSQNPRIIQSQVKPIYQGYSVFPKGPALHNDYSQSSANLFPKTRNYQGISNDANKYSYINSMVPTSDNVYNQEKKSYSYTSNLNMNSNYSLLQANNPLNKQNPFNRASLLGSPKDNGMSNFWQQDYTNYRRPSSNYNNFYENGNGVGKIESNYSYDHLLYKPSVENREGLEKIDSSYKLQQKGIDYSPNKYGNKNNYEKNTYLNFNTNYINTDKSDTASVRSYINKINQLEDPKQDYQNHYSNSPPLSNPFQRKSLYPTIGNEKLSQNKIFDYNTEKYGSYDHLGYKSSAGDELEKKYSNNNDQFSYPGSFDKYKYNYETQQKIQRKLDSENNMHVNPEGPNKYDTDNYYDNKRAFDNYEITKGYQKLGSYGQNKKYSQRIEKQIYIENKPVQLQKKTRKLYEFEDYNQHQDKEQLGNQREIYKYKNYYENSDNRDRVNNGIQQKKQHANRINDDLQKRYNFQRKDSYQYELQRVARNSMPNNEEQFDTNYANNFKRHQFEPRSQLQYIKNLQPVQLQQYQSPQFGTISEKKSANKYSNLNKYENMGNNRNSQKEIVRFDDNQQQQSQSMHQRNNKWNNQVKEKKNEYNYMKKEEQIPTSDPKQRQKGQYSSNILYRNQQFYRLQLI